MLAAVVAWRRVPGSEPMSQRIETWGTRICGGREFLEEGFAGEAGEDGEAEGLELVEVGEEGEVCVAEFAEAEAGVEDDLIEREAGGGGGGDALQEAGEDEGEDGFGDEGWEGWPGLRGAAGVHEDGAAAEVGAGGGHGGVPGVAADVVDDFGAGFDGGRAVVAW